MTGATEFSRFLERDTSAVFDAGAVIHFGERDAEFANAQSGGAKCPLLSQGLVRVSGDDARTFLNAQFTTNCLELSPSQAQLSAWCDPKGRVLFLFVLWTDGESFFISLPASAIARFVQRLGMYVLRAAVEIEDVSDRYAQIGIVENASGSAPAAWTVATEGPASLIGFGPGRARTLVVVADDSAIEYWLGVPHAAAGESVWHATNATEGMPVVDDQTSGEYLPQQLNLDRLGGVSFAKGCYPGQEIIARLKYRGEVKKRLAAASCTAHGAITVGAAVQAVDGTNTIGRVLEAIPVSARETRLTAVVDVNADWAALTIEGNGDERLRRLELPYDDA